MQACHTSQTSNQHYAQEKIVGVDTDFWDHYIAYSLAWLLSLSRRRSVLRTTYIMYYDNLNDEIVQPAILIVNSIPAVQGKTL